MIVKEISGGVKLPENWRIIVQLLNLLSLLDCLKRSDPKRCPNQCADVCALIRHILAGLNTTFHAEDIAVGKPL